MDIEEIEQRLGESINVPAFYIGKAFKIYRFSVDRQKEAVNIWTANGKMKVIPITEIEQFFSDYQHVFAPNKTAVAVKTKEEDDEPFGMHAYNSKATKVMSKKEETSLSLPMVSTEDIKVTISDLKNLLMNNIKKVQEDPKYIPQAKSINNDVNSIINLAKLQMTMIKGNKP